MATYVIGDVQGCYDSLIALLDKIDFDRTVDKLIFAGDLVNRGPKSLKTLRFIKGLGDSSQVVLGNHDLHLISIFYDVRRSSHRDNINKICNAKDGEELITWLRQQPLLISNEELDLIISHAGVHPSWSNKQALKRAARFSKNLRGPNYLKLLVKMYGNKPKQFSLKLSKYAKLRFTVNVFTRMRFCELNGGLNFTEKGSPNIDSDTLKPWFKLASKRKPSTRYIFGHWSSLGLYNKDNVICLDTGCVWGNKLTAYNATNDTFISVKAID